MSEEYMPGGYRIEIACTECHRAVKPEYCIFCSGTKRASILHDVKERYDKAIAALGDKVLETRLPGQPMTRTEAKIRELNGVK